jgi:PAS domain S-box-containing protein
MVEGQHKDGSIFPIRLSVSKVGEGADVVFIGMIDRLEDKSVSITINANGIIVSCNQVVEDMFGFKPGELLGNNVNMLMPSPHKERHGSYLQNYSKGGEAKVIGKVRNVPAKHKNGTVFPVSLQVEHVQMGNIELFRGKIEKVEFMEAMFSIDDAGIIVSCNHNFVLPLFGYTSNELVGQNISQLIPEIHQSTQDTIATIDTKAEPTLKKHKSTSSSSSGSNLSFSIKF